MAWGRNKIFQIRSSGQEDCIFNNSTVLYRQKPYRQKVLNINVFFGKILCQKEIFDKLIPVSTTLPQSCCSKSTKHFSKFECFFSIFVQLKLELFHFWTRNCSRKRSSGHVLNMFDNPAGKQSHGKSLDTLKLAVLWDGFHTQGSKSPTFCTDL